MATDDVVLLLVCCLIEVGAAYGGSDGGNGCGATFFGDLAFVKAFHFCEDSASAVYFAVSTFEVRAAAVRGGARGGSVSAEHPCFVFPSEALRSVVGKAEPVPSSDPSVFFQSRRRLPLQSNRSLPLLRRVYNRTAKSHAAAAARFLC